MVYFVCPYLVQGWVLVYCFLYSVALLDLFFIPSSQYIAAAVTVSGGCEWLITREIRHR